MRFIFRLLFSVFCLAGSGWAERDCILVRGALGDASFEEGFAEMESAWSRASEAAGDIRLHRVTSKEELREALNGICSVESGELWIVLIGHGTHDGRAAKFNLEGEDASAEELASWLAPWTKPLIVINTASASGPFLPALSGKDRVVVTATQSGGEVYAPAFGLHLARVIAAPEADLDRDGAVSILEATVVAADRVAAQYETENRLATEHALLDDNGDGKGTRADWFEGLKLARQPKEAASADGQRARQISFVRSLADRGLTEEQRRHRDELERSLDELKSRRKEMGEGDFFRKAEEILLELGRVNLSRGMKQQGNRG